MLRKQHRQALMLDNMMNMDGIAAGRSLRDRKPVTYTFGMCTAVLSSHYFLFRCVSVIYFHIISLLDPKPSSLHRSFE